MKIIVFSTFSEEIMVRIVRTYKFSTFGLVRTYNSNNFRVIFLHFLRKKSVRIVSSYNISSYFNVMFNRG